MKNYNEMNKDELAQTNVIRVEIETSVFKKDKLEFNVYKCFDKSGKKFTLKFTKDVKDVPTTNGYIFVAKDKINLDNSKKYPCFWVKEVLEFAEKENKEQDLSVYFD